MSNNQTMIRTTNEKTGLAKHLQRFGFGATDMACNFIWQVLTIYIMMYYTDIANIPVFYVSFLFLFARAIDGFTDVIMGVIIDKTKTKWGKSRPWFLFGAIPFGILSILCFAVPTSWGVAGRIIYAYITYLGISMAYTMVNAPISAVLPALSADKKERTILVSYRMILASIGSTMVTLLVAPLISLLGDGDDAKGVIWTMTIFSVVGVCLFFFAFGTIEEVVPQIKEDKITFKEAYNNIKINKHLWLFLGNMCLMWGSYFMLSGVMLYFFAYVIHSPLLFIAAPFLLTITQVISSAITPTLSKPFPKKKHSYSAASIINIGGMIIIFIVALTVLNASEIIGSGTVMDIDDNTISTDQKINLVSTIENTTFAVSFLFIGMLIMGFGHGWRTTIYYAMLAEPIDYGEWQTGINTSGISSSLTGFFAKLVLAIAGAIPTFLFGFTNYVQGDVRVDEIYDGYGSVADFVNEDGLLESSSHINQTDGTVWVIISCFIIVPLILAILSLLLVMFFWTIDDEIDAIRIDLNNGKIKSNGSADSFLIEQKSSLKDALILEEIKLISKKTIEFLDKNNIKKVNYCATKVRITTKNEKKYDENRIKEIGYFGVVVDENKSNYYQFIAGAKSKIIAKEIKELLK